jgi:hypothetical protein
VDGNERPFDPGELRFQALLGGIHDHLGALAENDVPHLDEAVHLAVAHVPGVELVELPLVVEDDTVCVFLGHLRLPATGRGPSDSRRSSIRNGTIFAYPDVPVIGPFAPLKSPPRPPYLDHIE